ncbi:MAG: hypothetical protein EPO67_21345, partial [Reyranella sp.]
MAVVTTTFIISDYYSPPGSGKPKPVDPAHVWVTFAGAFTQTGTPQTAGSTPLDLTKEWQSVRLSDM